MSSKNFVFQYELVICYKFRKFLPKPSRDGLAFFYFFGHVGVGSLLHLAKF